MPIKKDNKIRLRLSLPLGSPLRGGFPVDVEEEQQKLVSAGSDWTLSAGPASTASAYSQESYTLSPVPFRSAKLDKRRFALALESASWEGGWSAPIRDPQSPAGTFVLDLHSATLAPEEDDFFNKSEETLLKKADADEVKEPAVPIKDKEHSVTETKKEVVSKEAASRNKAQKPRSKSVFGKWFSKRPVLSPETVPESPQDDRPLLSTFPPRIEITVPSPGIKGVHDLPESDITPAELVKSLQSASIPGNRATMPSGWKPHRPPSPIPRMLKKSSRNSHKRAASSVSVAQAYSPIPPLPTLPSEQPINPTPKADLDYEGVESSGNDLSPAMQDRNSRKSLWRDSLQVRVKARAMKSAYYAPVPEDILSPPSSAL